MENLDLGSKRKLSTKFNRKKYPVNVKDKILSNTYNTRENSYNSFDIDINNINQDVLKNFNNHCVKYGYEELKR